MEVILTWQSWLDGACNDVTLYTSVRWNPGLHEHDVTCKMVSREGRFLRIALYTADDLTLQAFLRHCTPFPMN
jgi:hypothetical protein